MTLGDLARYHLGMNRKPRLMIYERKEVLLLLGLAVMVGVFAFTFGVHLGKRVPPRHSTAASGAPGSEPVAPEVKQLGDHAPTRLELQEQVSAAEGAAEVLADEALRDEVAKAGIQLERARQVELPRVSIAEKKGEPRESGDEPSKVSVLLAQALKRKAPEGEFTLQISAFSVIDSKKVEKSLKKWADAGLSPWIREVQIPGKGRWYRVYEGGFANRADAEKLGVQLKSQGSVASFVVTKRP